MAINLDSCLSQSVDMFRELQFWTAREIFGIERGRGEAAQRPEWVPGRPIGEELGEILHGVLGGQIGQLGGLENVVGDYLGDV